MDGDVRPEDWAGVLAGKRVDRTDVCLLTPLARSARGGSGAFLGKADDGQRYWVKTLNNPQGQLVAVTEHIVGKVGQLICSVVCDARLIEIPNDLVGWEFKPGHALQQGIAHASQAVWNCTETNSLVNRTDDDNSDRHVFILGIYDWCWGNDPQWLINATEENRCYSHDHGHFFPSGPNWDVPALLAGVDTEHQYADNLNGLTGATAKRVAKKLCSVTRDQMIKVLSSVPKSWPVSDAQLEHVGFFLERRARPAADRLVARFGA